MNKPTQAEIKRVEKAAEKHVKVAASGLTVLPTEQWRMFVDGYLEGFTAGASFASTDPEMMKAMLQPFAIWMDKHLWTMVGPDVWISDKDETCSFEVLISKYIQFITDKQKEDGKEIGR